MLRRILIAILLGNVSTALFAKQPCAILDDLEVPGVTITSAVDVPGEDTARSPGIPEPLIGVPASCAAAAAARPTNDSAIQIYKAGVSKALPGRQSNVENFGGRPPAFGFAFATPVLERTSFGAVAFASNGGDQAPLRVQQPNPPALP